MKHANKTTPTHDPTVKQTNHSYKDIFFEIQRNKKTIKEVTRVKGKCKDRGSARAGLLWSYPSFGHGRRGDVGTRGINQPSLSMALR